MDKAKHTSGGEVHSGEPVGPLDRVSEAVVKAGGQWHACMPVGIREIICVYGAQRVKVR